MEVALDIPGASVKAVSEFYHRAETHGVTPVLIDTDPGIDDALALLLALVSPELRVLAVTTVSGNVPVHTATRNTFTVLSRLPAATAVPVAEGAARPCRGEPVYAAHIHGEDGLGDVARLRNENGRRRYPPVEIALSPRRAADEILYQIRRSPQPVTLIALGPLTNIAAALEKDPQTVNRLERLVIMGGAVAVSGNITAAAEFNFYVDPEAARRVFASGLPITLVPLDVTQQVVLTRHHLAAAVSGSPSRIAQFVMDVTRRAFTLAEDHQGRPDIFLHDPLAIGAVIDPTLVSTRPLPVEIETRGALTRGLSVADRRLIRAERKPPPNAAVGLSVQSRRFLSLFSERLLCPP
ncbi:MAG TPA: nucleoside hydrolase [Desulfobacterales bacterium]